jgi:hypothetical protein
LGEQLSAIEDQAKAQPMVLSRLVKIGIRSPNRKITASRRHDSSGDH